MSFINGSSIMNRVSIGAVSLVLLLSACSSNEPKEEEFAMPESVMVDLEGGDATTAAPAAEAAAAEDDAAAAGAKTGQGREGRLRSRTGGNEKRQPGWRAGAIPPAVGAISSTGRPGGEPGDHPAQERPTGCSAQTAAGRSDDPWPQSLLPEPARHLQPRTGPVQESAGQL